MPFSYPPISAVVLAPLSMVPMAVASISLTLGSVVLLAFALRLFMRSLPEAYAGSRWPVKWLLPMALLLEPVRNTLNYGQINIILMGLVAFDCLGQGPRRTRGILVGVAAAMKLTPAAFILFFLVKKDYRAAGVTSLTFLGCAALGFLLAWRDSVQYWTSDIFQASRDGNIAYAANQSIQAVLTRTGIDVSSAFGLACWLILSVVTAFVAYVGMRRSIDEKMDPWALALNALAALLISPISWSHHWVWAEPVLLTLAIISWRCRDKVGLSVASAGTVILAVAPHWFVYSKDNNELTWNFWEQIIGDSYVMLGTVILVFSLGLFSLRNTRPRVRDELSTDLGKRIV